jgi:hypothetical protein
MIKITQKLLRQDLIRHGLIRQLKPNYLFLTQYSFSFSTSSLFSLQDKMKHLKDASSEDIEDFSSMFLAEFERLKE